MTPAWVAAAFGVVGAVIGAGATLAANWIATRAQLKLASDDRQQRRSEVRRTVSGEYLIAADSFIDGARELVSKMESATPGAECDAAYESYFACWEDLQRRRGPVVIAGPRELEERAEELYYQLGTLGDECDSWYAAHKNSRAQSRISKIGDVQRSVREARASFIATAQKYAYPTYKG